MPENDPYSNAPHLGPRVALTAAESQAALADAGRPVSFAAIVLSQHIAGGDGGAVRRYIHELEHGGRLQVDPWRLLERLALRFMPSPEEPPEDPDPADGAVARNTGEAGDSAAAA
ncbi:MAG: hypothetical protein ACHP9Z_34285 [Streptosporangiales bacterium]